ncbi:MAG: hypothetical protein AB3N28_11880, partial [Kordiimonas sp.]
MGWERFGPLYADDHEIVIAGTEIPALFDETPNSPYRRIFSAITYGAKTPVRLELMPPLRTLHVLLERSVDCLFVGGTNAQSYVDRGMPADELLISDVVNRTQLKLYTRPGEPIVNSVADLDGDVVAL